MALKSDENITARELLELQRQGFISSSKLLEELKKSKRKEGSSVLQQALASAPKAQMADPSAVDVGTVPKVRTPEAGPTSRRGLDKIYLPKAAEGMARDRNMYDMEPDPIIGKPDEMLAKAAYMKQVNQERQAEKNMVDMENRRNQQLANIAKDDSFAKTGKSLSYNQFLEDNVSGDLKAKKPSGLIEEILMSDTSPKLLEESTIRGDDPVNWLTEDIVQTSSQAAQADIDAGLEQEDDRFAQAQKRSGIMNDPSQMRVPQSEDEAKYGLGTETTETPLEGAGPNLFEEQTIKPDDPPEVMEMKQLQIDAQKKKPGAIKARKEMFAGLPREAKAMAKEELGNYYVDPNSGLAINLTELDASANRRAHMMLLQEVPKHQRTTMLANWGYIDKEDVENLPEDPQIQKAKIEAANRLAVAALQDKGATTRTGMQTSANLAIANLQDDTARTLGVRKLDLQEARDKVADRIATGELTIKQAAQELARTLGVRQEDRLQDMMEREFAFKYEEMEGMDAFRNAQLSQQNTQWTADFMRRGKNEQRAWLLNKHKQAMSDIKWAMENYQFDSAAVFASENGINLVPNIEMKMKRDAAKLAKKDLATGSVAALARQHLKVTPGAKTSDVNKFLNNYHQSRVNIVKELSKTRVDEGTGLTPLDAAFEQYGIVPFESLPPDSQKKFTSPAHYKIAMTQQVIEQKMTEAHGPFHAKYKDLEMQIQRDGGEDKGGTTSKKETTPKTGKGKETPKPLDTSIFESDDELAMGALLPGEMDNELSMGAGVTPQQLSEPEKEEWEALKKRQKEEYESAAKPRKGKQAGSELFVAIKNFFERIRYKYREGREKLN